MESQTIVSSRSTIIDSHLSGFLAVEDKDRLTVVAVVRSSPVGSDSETEVITGDVDRIAIFIREHQGVIVGVASNDREIEVKVPFLAHVLLLRGARAAKPRRKPVNVRTGDRSITGERLDRIHGRLAAQGPVAVVQGVELAYRKNRCLVLSG